MTKAGPPTQQSEAVIPPFADVHLMDGSSDGIAKHKKAMLNAQGTQSPSNGHAEHKANGNVHIDGYTAPSQNSSTAALPSQLIRRAASRSNGNYIANGAAHSSSVRPLDMEAAGSFLRKPPQGMSDHSQHANYWQPASSEDGFGSFSGGSPAEETVSTGVWQERRSLALLVLLYMLQGIPMGLTLGAMPFMLQSRLSYAQIGTFSLAAYPYSFKLLWSPIVDSLYSKAMGRRKTWIIPIQFCTASLLFCCAGYINSLYLAADVTTLTTIFFVFVLLAATQDIAVDGWALTLLSPPHVSWASTCQTIGTSCGFFTSFTIFLALQDVKFCNAYVRSWSWAQALFGADPSSDQPIVTLPGYLRFWGVVFAVVTALLWAFQPEGSEFSQEELAAKAAKSKEGYKEGKTEPRSDWLADVTSAYGSLWRVVKLRAVWGLAGLLLTYRLGVLVAEGAASLKLIDKGVPKETLAGLVLLQFPIELVSAVVAGRWAAAHSPAPPFLTSYWMRLAVNAATVAIVSAFPAGAMSLSLGTPAGNMFMALAGLSLLGSAVSTLAFTSLGSLFNNISDPDMGGAYLTLLNTIANMGVILPKAPAFFLIDAMTQTACVPSGNGPASTASAEQLAGLLCPKKPSEFDHSSPCTAAGGMCTVVRDGFYVVSWTCLAIGCVLGLIYFRTLPLLMRLPISSWRAASPSPDGQLKSFSTKPIRHTD